MVCVCKGGGEQLLSCVREYSSIIMETLIPQVPLKVVASQFVCETSQHAKIARRTRHSQAAPDNSSLDCAHIY